MSRAPDNLMLTLQKKYGIDNFIETGTYMGETALWASNNFKNVFTIEYSREIFDETSAKHGGVKNIDFIHGNSGEKLPEIAEKISGKSSIFWLDAHYSGGNTAGGGEKAPLLDEVRFILGLNEKQYVFIDDARFMLTPLSEDIDEYPDVAEISQLIDTTQYFMAIIEDMIIILPREARTFFHSYFHSTLLPEIQAKNAPKKKKKKNLKYFINKLFGNSKS